MHVEVGGAQKSQLLLCLKGGNLAGKAMDEEEDVDTKPSCVPLAVPDEYDRSQLPDLLRVYYTWLFPYDKYFDWLQYGR